MVQAAMASLCKQLVSSPIVANEIVKGSESGISCSQEIRSSFVGQSLRSFRKTSRSNKVKAGSFTVKNVASEPRSAPASTNGATPISDDAFAIAANIKYHAEYTPSFSYGSFETKQAYLATAQSIRDILIQRWNLTFDHFEKTNPKMIYYLSMEFLQGRALINSLGNLGVTDSYTQALEKLGVALEDLVEAEPNAALGNGGLGRLASCFLDSIATLNYPGWGYGLRYKYGLFKQAISEAGQVEMAEPWLETGTPWEIVRHDISYPIKFFGEVVDGKWVGGENVKAVAYDVPIPGYRTKNCISLRLWQAVAPSTDFDLAAFNNGEHEKAALAQANAEKICSVLYPGDSSIEGKELRLKQQYMLCSASIQDILATFERRSGAGGPVWADLPNKVAVQMNDTHPTLCGPEILRILIDEKGLTWEEAFPITQATVAYTNHTVLPEALEKWPLDLIKKLMPRHLEIIEKIDEQFIEQLVASLGSAEKEVVLAKIESMRVLENVELPESVKSKFAIAEPAKTLAELETEEVVVPKTEEKKKPGLIRMANLAVIEGHAVNGVAEIHSEIVKDEVFNDFYQLWPEKFQNKTNGVTPRRWMSFCNPEMSKVITKWLKTEDWVLNADLLAGLKEFADNKEFKAEWVAAKVARKEILASYLKEKTGYEVNKDALFDIQVKRIHEYKRQLLNIMGIIYRYKKMKELSPEERKAKYVPRVCLFGGKAFATYWQAKRIVKLITDVGRIVNTDPEIGDLLKVIFVPDYNVSVAEVLIPASELSQHISTAGMEASGTSNMKFSMNGCLLIGTLDGANVEIREEVGEDNFFLFGAYANEIAGLRVARSKGEYVPDPRFEEVKEYIRSGVFGDYDYNELLGSLEGNEGFGRGDYFLVGYDFAAYIECQDKVDEAYRDQEAWTRSSILNTANSGKFSSDRTIHQYAKEIWGITPSPVA